MAEGTCFQDAWTGQQYEATVSVRGGIEPYKIECKSPLPPGLNWDKGQIFGIPEDSTVPQGVQYKDYSVLITVNDQQRTYSLDIDREPQLSREFRLRVHRLKSISLTSVLPAVRAGQKYVGAIVASGGKQRLYWESDDLDLLHRYGFNLDSDNGVVKAESVRTYDARRVVRLSFSVGVIDPSNAVPPQKCKCVIHILPSMHFRVPDNI